MVHHYREVTIFGYMHEYSAYRTEGECEDFPAQPFADSEDFPAQPFADSEVFLGSEDVLDCRSESNECERFEFGEEGIEDLRVTQCVELDGEEFGAGCGAAQETVELVACSAETIPTSELVTVAYGDAEFAAPEEIVVVSSEFAIVLDY